MDAIPSTGRQLTFSGSASVRIEAGLTGWSDMLSYPIEREKSYLVSFLVDNGLANGNAWAWTETVAPAAVGSYMIPSSSGPGAADIAAAVWSTRGDVIATNKVFGVQYMFTTYPLKGTYTTRIYDTHMAAPAYSDIGWAADVPSGAALTMKVRTGNSNDLSDATAWTNIVPMTAPGSISPGNRRYLQFRAAMTPDASGLLSPRLKDVTIRWPGPEQFVDVGGTFTRGPTYGVFEIRVDGERIKTGLKVDLEIFKDTRGYRGTRRIRSALSAEVRPRNTGR
jgi:hypothetical protein